MSPWATSGVTVVGWIRVYTLRMNVVLMAVGEQRLVHAVGWACTYW